MNENVDIFIGTHKNYIFPTNNVYKIISNSKEKLDTNLKIYYEENEPLHDLFSDVIRIDYIKRNIKLKDYVGLVQYRRNFEFYNDVPNIEEIFDDYDIILPNQYNFNLYYSFAKMHDLHTIDTCLDILYELYPDFPISRKNFKQINTINLHNIFIMKSKDFYNMHNFLFSIFNEFIKRENFNTMDDVKKYVEKYYGMYDSNNVRLFGFLGERLISVYCMINFKNPKYINVIENI